MHSSSEVFFHHSDEKLYLDEYRRIYGWASSIIMDLKEA